MFVEDYQNFAFDVIKCYLIRDRLNIQYRRGKLGLHLI